MDDYIDPRYECDAPTFVDFAQMATKNYQDDDKADEWFDKHDENSAPVSFEDNFSEVISEESEVRDTYAVSNPPSQTTEVHNVKVETDSSEAVVPVISKNEAVPLVEASKTHCGGDGGVEAEGDIKVKADTINEDTTVPSVRSNSDTEESMDMGIMQEPDHISRAGIVQSESEGTLSSEATGGSEGEEESSVTRLSPQAAVHPVAGKESSTAKMVARFFNVELKDTRTPRAAAKKASNSIHDILAGSKHPVQKKPPHPRPTENNEPSNQCKSTEDLQLEEIKRLQVEAKRKLRRSRQSFHRLAKVSGPMKTVKGSKPPTETKEFNFSKMTLGSSGRNQSDNSISRSFADTLRSGNDTSCSYDTSMPSKKPPTPDFTVPKPFKFKLDQRPGLRSSASTVDMPRAEFIAKYEHSTPPRFRTTPVGPKAPQHPQGGGSGANVGTRVTLPKTPNLTAKNRKRPLTQKSISELEDEEVAEMKKYRFTANPINPKVMKRGGLHGVPFIKNNPGPTKAVSPAFASKRLAEKRRALHGEEEQLKSQKEEGGGRTFSAQLMPDFSKMKGLPAKRIRPLTEASSPSLIKRRRLNSTIKEDEEDEDRNSSCVIKANPVPNFEAVFAPQFSQRSLVPEPFSFEERDKSKPVQETFAEKLIRQEQKPAFKAQPIPDFTYQPPKLTPSVTNLSPFNLHTNVRGERHMQNWKEQMEKEQEERKREAEFKAKDDVSYLYNKPFAPEKSTKPLVHVDNNLVLHSEVRSSQRAKYEAERKKRSQLLEVENLQRRALREAKDAKEMVKYRRSLVHKAQPIVHYAPITIKPSDKPVTQPISPQLSAWAQNTK